MTKKEKYNKYHREWERKNKDKRKLIIKKYRDDLRIKALLFYSNGKIECSCCFENIIEFMCIDHINGGGKKHRREIFNNKDGNGNIYQWLKTNKYPDGFQVLCHNCNLAKGFYGSCPHKKLSTP